MTICNGNILLHENCILSSERILLPNKPADTSINGKMW